MHITRERTVVATSPCMWGSKFCICKLPKLVIKWGCV